MPIDPEELRASLEALTTGAADANRDLTTVLEDVVHGAAGIFGVAGSGVMIADQQSVTRYVASSDEPGSMLEKTEAEAVEGPCTEAFVYQAPCDTSDVQADPRWPRLAAAMQGTPVRAVLGVPVRLGAITVGTLDVYRTEVHEWDEQERSALDRYGAVVSNILASTLAAHRSRELSEQLQYALDYRVVIERGVGFLMARDRTDAVTAFNRLRTAARSSQTKIGTVAEELLSTGALPGE